jgi:hypothetical protein
MLKNILKLEGTQELTINQQKNILGSVKPPSGNCSCFCYSNGVKIGNSCFSYCPDGTVPGLNQGSTGNCTFPFEN